MWGGVQYSGFLVYNIDKCGEGYSTVDSWFTAKTNVGRGTVQWILGLQHRQMWGGVQYNGFLVYSIDKCGEGTVQWIIGLQHRQCREGYSTVDSWFTT